MVPTDATATTTLGLIQTIGAGNIILILVLVAFIIWQLKKGSNKDNASGQYKLTESEWEVFKVTNKAAQQESLKLLNNLAQHLEDHANTNEATIKDLNSALASLAITLENTNAQNNSIGTALTTINASIHNLNAAILKLVRF